MRERLPDDREGLTHHFRILNGLADGRLEDIDGYIQTGCYPDGRVGEIFIKVGRSGDATALLDQWAMAFSVALQHGAPFEELCRKFTHQQFQPAGATDNPDIPRCTSPVDYACRWLLLKYVKAITHDEKQIEASIGPDGSLAPVADSRS